MPLVRTPRLATDTGAGFDTGGSAQPTISRSFGDSLTADLTGGAVGIATLQREDGEASADMAAGSPSPASVQREDGSDAAVAAAASSATGGGGAPAGGSERELDELARRLYDRIRSRLRSELLVDRERAGALSDLV